MKLTNLHAGHSNDDQWLGFIIEENRSWPQNVNIIVSQIGLRPLFIDIDIDLHLQLSCKTVLYFSPTSL